MGYKILLVDDQEDVLDVLGNLLEMDGYAVRYADSYNKALALVEQVDFDLVITDYSMPGMHGIYLLDMIKSSKPDMPVIIITAYGSDELRDKARRKGADLVLDKPFSFDALNSGIKKVMRKRRKP